MATVRCDNGHNYDNLKHTHCPYCPVPGLRDVKIPGMQAASMNRPAIPPTEPASLQGSGAPIRGGSPAGGGTAGVTVGIFQKQTGIDPVVGWLVCIKGTNKGRDYRLHSDLNKLGRAPNMDVCIEGDDTISRENHCQIAFSSRHKTFSIIPGDGRNLIYLNDQAVLQATSLKAYDLLDLGESSFLFMPFCSDRFNWETGTVRQDVEPADTGKRSVRDGEPPVV
jgi:FHA domain